MIRECSHCQYWYLTDQEYGPIGECRFNPPIHLPRFCGQRPRGTPDEYPLTRGNQWCGHYVPKETLS